jgi:trehalose-phosphatase
LLAQVAPELQPLTSAFPRAWVENNKLGLTLHFRQVAPESRQPLLDRAQALLAPFGEQLEVDPERQAWQVLPVSGWNKGSAVELILEQMPAETLTFYAGDAVGDRDPYLFTAGRGGVAVSVGSDAPGEVRWLVPTPDALIDLLAQLLPAITVAGLK